MSNMSERDAFGIAVSAMAQLHACQTNEITKGVIKNAMDIVSKHANELSKNQKKDGLQDIGGGESEMESQG